MCDILCAIPILSVPARCRACEEGEAAKGLQAAGAAHAGADAAGGPDEQLRRAHGALRRHGRRARPGLRRVYGHHGRCGAPTLAPLTFCLQSVCPCTIRQCTRLCFRSSTHPCSLAFSCHHGAAVRPSVAQKLATYRASPCTQGRLRLGAWCAPCHLHRAAGLRYIRVKPHAQRAYRSIFTESTWMDAFELGAVPTTHQTCARTDTRHSPLRLPLCRVLWARERAGYGLGVAETVEK